MSRQYLGLSVGQWLQDYDWEEPQFFNYSWHARRVRCAESVFKAAVAHWPVAEVNGEVLLFLVTYVIFFYGSSAFCDGLEAQAAAVPWADVPRRILSIRGTTQIVCGLMGMTRLPGNRNSNLSFTMLSMMVARAAAEMKFHRQRAVVDVLGLHAIMRTASCRWPDSRRRPSLEQGSRWTWLALSSRKKAMRTSSGRR